MTALPRRLFTPEEYLLLETRATKEKSQYVAGEIFAMSGVSPAHDAVCVNLHGMLYNRLRGRPCRSYTSDMRVEVQGGEMYTYPDATALCGEPRFNTTHNPPSLLNPQVIFEVLSPSTAVFDRGEKSVLYRGMDSLTDYVLIDPERVRLEHHARQPDGSWHLRAYDSLAHRIELPALECALPLAEIYERVDPPGRA